MKRILNFGPFFIIIAALLWSADGIFRIGLYSLPPIVIVFYEHLIGLILLCFVFYKWMKDIKKMTKKEWGAIGFVSLFSGVLGTLCYTAALQKVHFVQFSVVVLLQQLQPIWAILAATIVLKEKVQHRFILWAALALIASYLMTFKDLRINISNDPETILAGLLALFAGIFWGTSTAVSKIVLNKVSFITGTFLRFLFAPVFAFIIIVFSGQIHSVLSISGLQIETLMLIAFSTGMLALGIYYYGLKKTEAKVSTLYELAWPASAIFIDLFLYKKTFTLTQIVGVILLFISLYMVSRKNHTLLDLKNS